MPTLCCTEVITPTTAKQLVDKLITTHSDNLRD